MQAGELTVPRDRRSSLPSRSLRAPVESARVVPRVRRGVFLPPLPRTSAFDGSRWRNRNSVHLQEQRDQDRAKTGGRVFGHQLEPRVARDSSGGPSQRLAVGVDSVVPHSGTSVPPASHRARARRFRAERPARAHVDLELLIRIVLGLLAIVLAVETIAGERASGALLALLGQPVRPHQILAGKLPAARRRWLRRPRLLVRSRSCVWRDHDQSLLHPRIFWPRSARIFWSVRLYTFICFAAGLLISILFSSYRSALTATFVFWVLCALIAPPAAVVIAESMFPVRPRSAVEAERERLVQAGTLGCAEPDGQQYTVMLGGREVGSGAETTRHGECGQGARRALVDGVCDGHAQTARGHGRDATPSCVRSSGRRGCCRS